VLDLPQPILRVESMSPPPDGHRAAPPAVITATFTTDLLPSSVTPTTFRLVRSGGDGVFGNANDVAITPRSVSATGRQAALSLVGQVLPRDTYQVTLAARGLSPILDAAGRVLDGKFKGSLPSGDGTGGTDFVAQFTLTTLGDYDGDNDVDQEDFGHFQTCLTGPYAVEPGSACEDADLNADQHVDQADLIRFRSCMGGPAAPVPALCR